MIVDLDLWIRKFLIYCQIDKGLSTNTLLNYELHLSRFSARIHKTSVPFEQIDINWMRQYIQYLSTELCSYSIPPHCTAIRQFYRFYCEENGLDFNPAEEGFKNMIEVVAPLPPSHSIEELQMLVGQPDRSTISGLRDAIMIELGWLTGLRVSEIINLKKVDVIPGKDPYLRIFGKGNKERILNVPSSWFESVFKNFLLEAHAANQNYESCPYVFVSNRLKPMTRQNFWLRIKKYARMARIKEDFSPHDLRHAFAYHTLMAAQQDLDSGHALVVLKQVLGHESITTTQRYLGITNRDVQNEFEIAHPRQ